MSEHGTRAAYQRGCRCRSCRRANAAAVAFWRATQGADPWIGAEGVRARLVAWQARGIGLRCVAANSGVSRGQLRALRSGASPRIRQSDALLLLSLELQPAPGSCTAAWQTKRWVRALLVEGYTRGRLARLQGLKRPVLELDTDRVRRSTEQRMGALYQALTAESLDGPHP